MSLGHSEPTREELVRELHDMVARARRFAVEIDHPVAADLTDADNFLTDERGESA